MTDEWYSPREIWLSIDQVIWLLPHIALLRDGYWPPDHKETGYVGGGRAKGGKKRAYFETPVQVATEIDRRLEMVGLDGLLLEMVFMAGTPNVAQLEQHIANCLREDVGSIARRVDSALRYVSGKCPKWEYCPGVGECVQCQTCSRFKDKDGNVKCTKKPRRGRTYSQFRQHKRGNR